MSVVYRRRALADLESIFTYISRDNPKAAATVIDRIVGSIDRLAVFPYSGCRGVKAGTRELLVLGLPYLAVYKVIDRSGTSVAEIVAIYHTAQKRPDR